MSFILDALRKSEVERQRNRQPGSAPNAAAAGNPRNRLWIPLVALLVGLNISLLIVLWYTSGQPDNESALIAGPPAPAGANALPMPRIAATADNNASRDLSAELLPPPPAPTAARAADNSSAQASNSAPPVADETLPSFTELRLNGTLNIGDLHLDVHVYSERPEERFVFINTVRYSEGEKLQEGPAVQKITTRGVVLNQQGQRFLLERD